jgi:NAD(P)-dependent dehydrogenase (short-subunit alcohol dehydrogenase family)
VERNFAVNSLAPFLLTELLWELLEATAAGEARAGRVVNVSSSAHAWSTDPQRLLAAMGAGESLLTPRAVL